MNYKKWSNEDYVKLSVLVQEGSTAAEIANIMGRSENSVKHYRSQLGLSKRKGSNTVNEAKLLEYTNILDELNIYVTKYEGMKGNSEFRCKLCSNVWFARVHDVCHRQQSCPSCTSRVVSKVGTKWLNTLNVPIREYRIPNTKFVADGYDPSNNTVYEFLGDYWHGNLDVYNYTDINPTRCISYGELFAETVSKFDVLKQLGYNLKFVWERDFQNGILLENW